MRRERVLQVVVAALAVVALVVVVFDVSSPPPRHPAGTSTTASPSGAPAPRSTPVEACVGLLEASAAIPPVTAGIERWATPSLARRLLATKPGVPLGATGTKLVVTATAPPPGMAGEVLAKTTWTTLGESATETW